MLICKQMSEIHCSSEATHRDNLLPPLFQHFQLRPQDLFRLQVADQLRFRHKFSFHLKLQTELFFFRQLRTFFLRSTEIKDVGFTLAEHFLRMCDKRNRNTNVANVRDVNQLQARKKEFTLLASFSSLLPVLISRSTLICIRNLTSN